MFSSKVQQQIQCLQVSDILITSSVLLELQVLKPTILFCKPSKYQTVKIRFFHVFRAAAQNVYEQTEIVSSLQILSIDTYKIYQLPQWTPQK